MDNLGEVCTSHGRLARRCTECKYEELSTSHLELATKYVAVCAELDETVIALAAADDRNEALGAEYEELSLYAEDLRTKYSALRNSVLGPSLRTEE